MPLKPEESGILRHYRRLFKLPSMKLILAMHLTLGFAYGYLLFPERGLDPQLALYGLAFMPLPASLLDALTYQGACKGTALRLRRLSALSLSSNVLWFLVVAVGKAAAFLSPRAAIINPLAQAFAFSAALCLRFVVFTAVSFANPIKCLLLAVSQPALSILIFGLLLGFSGVLMLQALVASVGLLLTTAFILRMVDREGHKRLGVGSLKLFRAFAWNWLDGEKGPLEEIFEGLGVERDTQVKLLAFGEGDEPFSLLVVPYIHSGPFKNVGSSVLPALIQSALAEDGRTNVLVFHGPAGHEMNLTSQKQNARLIEELRSQARFSFQPGQISQMVRATWEAGKASCQVFNDAALLILTTAPRSMEDLPSTIAEEIGDYGRHLGFREVFIVDAHNSTSGTPISLTPDEIASVKRAAFEALRLASMKPRHSARVGAFRVNPKEFTLSQGMGPGGIAVNVISAGGQTVAYVIIDGNNMVTGLREETLKRIKELGFHDGEVATTDTHAVNATITGRGYHPVGEAIDHEKLLSYIMEGVRGASADQRELLVAWKDVNIRDLKVLGERGLKGFIDATDASIAILRRLSLILYPLVTAFLMMLLFL